MQKLILSSQKNKTLAVFHFIVDEVITFEEFQEFYKTMPDDPEKELMRAFKVFDKNGDGTLDKSELKIVLREFGENEADLSKTQYSI